MDCPVCGLTNPDDAVKCDCGYDFSTKTGGAKPKPSGWLVDIIAGLIIGNFFFGFLGFLVDIACISTQDLEKRFLPFTVIFTICGDVFMVKYLRYRRGKKRIKQ